MKLQALKSVGKSLLSKLEKAGIDNTEALLLHLPEAYEDRRIIGKIAETVSGQKEQLEGIIQQVNITPFGKKHLSCYFSDETGLCKIHLFRFYPNQVRLLQKGNKIRCYGEISRKDARNHCEMIHPEWKIIAQNDKPTGAITPLYPAIEGIRSNVLHKLILQLKNAVNFAELLPDEVRQPFRLPTINQALNRIHFPENRALCRIYQDSAKARYRLALEEILAHHLNAKKSRRQAKTVAFATIEVQSAPLKKLIENLGFTPTKAQSRVIAEIYRDFRLKQPMSRLVQGDVGSGKTVVAAAALLQTALSQFQSIMMAPTEILAEQHYHTLKKWLSPFAIEVIFVAQKLSTREKKQAGAHILAIKNCVIVGTHAVFQEKMTYPNLGLVVIDEQHRFGVEQRLALIGKAAEGKGIPHQLVMTATPIPRTLAMTVYGDLDLSVIDELPPNRKAVKTSVINQEKKADLIGKLKAHIASGGQAYWVCPLIESSEALAGLQDADSLYTTIKKSLPEVQTALVHGKMKAKEKTEVMHDFKAGKIDILVATTVIEVGVDVPNADIMIIDNAERLGLSQLHQLRGRVGRGTRQSHCVLLYQSPLTATAKKRLALMRRTQDGFIIAEEDLKLRGPGDIFGKNQTGEIHFKVADLDLHRQLFDEVTEIGKILSRTYPQLIDKIIGRWLDKAAEYIKA